MDNPVLQKAIHTHKQVPEARARAPQLADVKEAGATLLGESLSDDVFVPPHMLGRSLQSAAVASAVEPLRPVICVSADALFQL